MPLLPRRITWPTANCKLLLYVVFPMMWRYLSCFWFFIIHNFYLSNNSWSWETQVISQLFLKPLVWMLFAVVTAAVVDQCPCVNWKFGIEKVSMFSPSNVPLWKFIPNEPSTTAILCVSSAIAQHFQHIPKLSHDTEVMHNQSTRWGRLCITPSVNTPLLDGHGPVC